MKTSILPLVSLCLGVNTSSLLAMEYVEKTDKIVINSEIIHKELHTETGTYRLKETGYNKHYLEFIDSNAKESTLLHPSWIQVSDIIYDEITSIYYVSGKNEENLPVLTQMAGGKTIKTISMPAQWSKITSIQRMYWIPQIQDFKPLPQIHIHGINHKDESIMLRLYDDASFSSTFHQTKKNWHAFSLPNSPIRGTHLGNKVSIYRGVHLLNILDTSKWYEICQIIFDSTTENIYVHGNKAFLHDYPLMRITKEGKVDTLFTEDHIWSIYQDDEGQVCARMSAFGKTVSETIIL